MLVRDPRLDSPLGLIGYARRVRAHIRDEAGRALSTQLDAFVQLLGDAHRVAWPEAQAAGRVLLHRGRDIGQVRALGAALLLDAQHLVGRTLELAQLLVSLGLRAHLELGVLACRRRARRAVQPREEMLGGSLLGQLGVDRP